MRGLGSQAYTWVTGGGEDAVGKSGRYDMLVGSGGGRRE